MTAPGTGGAGLADRVAAAARSARPGVPAGPVADAVDAVVDRLADRRLRIAVGGRMNAGKSTLINALVGQRVAATAATECTRLVAWFRGSHQNRIEVRRTDGTSYHVPGRPGGGVPDDLTLLGADRASVRELVVEVVNDRLDQRYTIVDTPGMDSLSGLDEIAMAALARADALLYVMPHPGAGDTAAIEALRRQAGERLTAANVLGVLSRVDELGDGVGDPWPRARRLTSTYGARLRGVVGDVVPVVGLLAATAAGDTFTEDDAALVRRLAVADAEALGRALYSGRTFRAWSTGPLSSDERDLLAARLGRYGITVATDACRKGISGAAPLLAELRRHSGIDALESAITDRFVAVADRLRAGFAISTLERVVRAAPPGPPALVTLATTLATLRRDPRLRQADLGTALVDLGAGRLRLTDEDAAALVTLATAADPAGCVGLDADASAEQLRQAADREILRWRRREDDPSRLVQRHARTAREVCEAIFFSVTS
ncbi:GTPase domain-containing protein [Solwaraspora sp. WMMD791]|uniref:GTPase domain-containing protein n=1 Tax=Solwaraspora sp. WMMD791 TaxID=3016086 RepID=UPI00249A923C|nr:GTPase domain-containing protein [Solwaraspora sp. WMMD791]WFE29293.1 GTPase domain-containing protein [Solwaraspora sp. WMMD791]